MKDLLPAARPGFCASLSEALLARFAGRDDIAWGTRYGFPTLYAGGKRFAYVCAKGIVVRLPEAEAYAAARRSRVAIIDPVGGPRDSTWVLLAGDDASALAMDTELLERSIAYVGDPRRRW